MNSKKDVSERSNCCKLCNKIYSSYKTLWTHTKKFHNDDVVLCCTNVVDNVVLCCTLLY